MNPYSPLDARRAHSQLIPDIVLELINEYLAERYRDDEPIVIQQLELTNELIAHGITEEEFFERGWIQFEDIYRRRGWNVEYSRPEGIGRWTFQELNVFPE